ncbi:hypothetical protein N7E81_18750 [Reichenbachiella carrageenanivorans]|uniref:3-keto-disaccharide hydrolase domain-containing protein n=1 Tax=Reichenbachiella carrageenanivorans TaxID=2979869 RepID=A0ABY6D1B9_9BACT|nr:hypothetical protein [Reichenbachiella carrageenanivorans]UXX79395.1 hypothetical protein N7E81_18750 [Reichenbachiella carrageenanivorans]
MNMTFSKTKYWVMYLMVMIGSLPLFAQSDIPDDYRLVYSQDFESPQSMSDFEATDASAWKMGSGATGQTMALFGKSNYRGAVRSPFNITILKEIIVEDFVMDIDLNQTGKEYGHRDLCLFFGFQNATNFYYVHLASIADDHANNIFLVNDEPRIKIASKTTAGVDWADTNSWHKVRIVRKVKEGIIQIYFDNMQHPVMEAQDQHFAAGRIGVGSFDDTGQFDNIKIWAPKVVKQKQGFFQ